MDHETPEIVEIESQGADKVETDMEMARLAVTHGVVEAREELAARGRRNPATAASAVKLKRPADIELPDTIFNLRAHLLDRAQAEPLDDLCRGAGHSGQHEQARYEQQANHAHDELLRVWRGTGPGGSFQRGFPHDSRND